MVYFWKCHMPPRTEELLARDYEAQIRNYRGPEPLEPWDGCLQWAEECLPLQEKQSCWPGLLEELVKVFVGDKSTQTQQRESWRRWKTLSLCRWNSWVMESSRSSKNRAGSRLQPGHNPGGRLRRKQSLKRQMRQICPKPPMAAFPGIAEDFSQAPSKRLTSHPGYPSPSSPVGRAGARLDMENFWESPGEERRLQLHRSVS